MDRERLEDIVRELVEDMAESCDEETLDEVLSGICTQEEREYLGI